MSGGGGGVLHLILIACIIIYVHCSCYRFGIVTRDVNNRCSLETAYYLVFAGRNGHDNYR